MAQRNIPLVDLPPEADFSSNGDGVMATETQSSLDRWELLWKRRAYILRFALKGLVLFVAIAFLIPPRYESVTELMPPDSSSSSLMAMLSTVAGKGSDSLASYAGDLLGVKSSGALFIGILQSRTVEDALVRRFDLRKVYWVKRWEDARRKLEGRTYISEDRKSGIIEVRVQDRSPERAQAMAKAYVEELDRAVATTSTSSARREREFLETRLKVVKADLDQASVDFSEFASKNTAIDIPEQGKAMVEAAAKLQGELIAAEAQRQGLGQIYTANNVRVRTLDGQIRELRDQLNKLGSAGVGSSSPDSEDSLYPSIRKLPLLGVTYADLYRRTKIQEAVFEILTKQYEMAKVQEAKEIPTVKVLDPPNFPERRASPPRILIIVLGFVLSLVVAGVLVVGHKAWDDGDPQDPRRVLTSKIWSDLKRDSATWRVRPAEWRSRRNGASGHEQAGKPADQQTS